MTGCGVDSTLPEVTSDTVNVVGATGLSAVSRARSTRRSIAVYGVRSNPDPLGAQLLWKNVAAPGEVHEIVAPRSPASCSGIVPWLIEIPLARFG